MARCKREVSALVYTIRKENMNLRHHEEFVIPSPFSGYFLACRERKWLRIESFNSGYSGAVISRILHFVQALNTPISQPPYKHG